MPPIHACPLPANSLLARHSGTGDHTDCYTVELPRTVSLEAFVAAFYTGAGFQPERLFLYLVGRGANLAEASSLARGEVERFAAWRVEARTTNELLLADFMGRTRSWLQVVPLGSEGTRLHFGSGVIRREGRAPGARAERALVRLILPFHASYSRVLLRSAAAALLNGK